MAAAHQGLFDRLCAQKDVVVVTGGSVTQVREQVTTRFDGRYFVLAQSGNEAIDKAGSMLWKEALSPEQSAAINAFIDKKLQRLLNMQVRDEHDLVEHRGAQITYSVLGFHEDVAKKYAYDPDDSKRAAALAALATEVATLKEMGIEVTPAGTTSFNFIIAGKHKGFNVARLIKREGWEKDECVYVGDALFPGGNDETVIGVIPTHEVKDPDETFEFVQELLAS